MKVTSFTPFSSSRLPCHYTTQNHGNDTDRRVHRKLPSSRPLSHSRLCLTITSLFLLIVFAGSCDAWFSFYTSQLATTTPPPTTENQQQQDLSNRTALNTTSTASKNEEDENAKDNTVERSKRQAEDISISILNETVTDEVEPLPTPLPVAEEAKDNPESVVTENDVVEPDSNSTSSSSNNSNNTLPCPWFTCKNGRCVIDTWRCDLQDDCGDGSDEDGCDEVTECPAPVNGGTPSFRCKSGMCISSAWICDSFKDCPHGDDEINCQNSTKESRG